MSFLAQLQLAGGPMQVQPTHEQVFRPLNAAKIGQSLDRQPLRVISSTEADMLCVIAQVKDAQDFDDLPVFLQNYVADFMLPGFVCLAIERLELEQGLKTYFVLPYFLIYAIQKGQLVPHVALAGEDNRAKAVDNLNAASVDALGNLQGHMKLLAQYLGEIQ